MQEQQQNSAQMESIVYHQVDNELCRRRQELVLHLLESGVDIIQNEFAVTKHKNCTVKSTRESESGPSASKQDEGFALEVGGHLLEPEVIVTHKIHLKPTKAKLNSITHYKHFFDNFNDDFEKTFAEAKNEDIMREDFQNKLLRLCAKLVVRSKSNLQNWELVVKQKLDQFHLALQLEKSATEGNRTGRELASG